MPVFELNEAGMPDAPARGVVRMELGKGSAMCADRRAALPVRVIVCQWSRTRPVFSTQHAGWWNKGRGRRHGDKARARPSGVKKCPSPNRRSAPD